MGSRYLFFPHFYSTTICLYRHPNSGLPLIAILMRLYTADLSCYLAAIIAHCFAQNDPSQMTDKFKPTNVRMRAPVKFLVLFGHLFDMPLTNVLTNLSATVSFLLLLTLGERKVPCQVTVVTRKRNEPGGSRQMGVRLHRRMNWVYLCSP